MFAEHQPHKITISKSSKVPVPVCSQAALGSPCCCCSFCETAGCDVRFLPCKCCFHSRCCPLEKNKTLTTCPQCRQGVDSLQLLPMSFDELDLAKRQAELTQVSDKRGRKRKNKTIARLTGRCATETTTNSANEELRTGRWTTEETEYCDSLIVLFEQGSLPLPDGIKLNEFLSNMLKSKQSRLTKKMKNAGLSGRQYKAAQGHVADLPAARAFSQLECEFFASIACRMERAEIRFHMQKEWRELFSRYCMNSIQHPLDANPWLYSVEELDRRAALQRDAERMTRRKVMMGQALTTDGPDSRQRGVYIEHPQPPQQQQAAKSASATHPEEEEPNSMKYYASPFIAKIMLLMKKHEFPFEHVDAWVPSYVQPGNNNNAASIDDQKCRLCFAGCGTLERKIVNGANTTTATTPLTEDEEFHLLSFGEYSQKFSFNVNCGLPGRVYNSGVASWEQGIQNAPLSKFERCGGARQWGIQTVLGIPIPSPTVGRIVVVFYSIFDRSRNLVLVNRIAEDLSKLRPSPKWKLVVDVGTGIPKSSDASEEELASQNNLLQLLDKYTPTEAPQSVFLPGYTSLRLLLVRKHRSDREKELVKSTIACFDAYRKSGRNETDSLAMTARDFMALSRNNTTPKQQTEASKVAPPRQNSAATAMAQQQQQLNALQSQQQQLNSLQSQQQQQLLHALQNQQQQQHLNTLQNQQQSTKQSAQPKSDNSNLSTVSYSERSLPVASTIHQDAATLASLGSSPALGGMFGLPSLGTSPALHPISSQDVVAPFGLSTSQLSSLLQNFSNDGARHPPDSRGAQE